MAIGTSISIITLNVNRLNAPTKRTKTRPMYMLSTGTHFRPQDPYRLKIKGWKNIFYANGKQKKAGVAILMSDEINLKVKKL